MKTIYKRFSAFMLSVFLVFGVCSSQYLEVHAIEWGLTELTFAESLGWLLGLLGLGYQETQQWSVVAPEYEQDFIDYAEEHGLTYQEITSWTEEVGKGKLNQVSEVWEKFKSWASSLVNNNDFNFSVLSSVQSVSPNKV